MTENSKALLEQFARGKISGRDLFLKYAEILAEEAYALGFKDGQEEGRQQGSLEGLRIAHRHLDDLNAKKRIEGIVQQIERARAGVSHRKS